jgi:hypothetical protein
MAYLHCHACKWEQDDFWSKTYNPGVVLRRQFREYLRPRMIHAAGGIDGDIFSWRLLGRAIARYFRVHMNMVWPTKDDWFFANTTCGMFPDGPLPPPPPPGCPDCGNELCID